MNIAGADHGQPLALLLLIALLQGLALLLLHQAIDLEFWPWPAPQWLLALYSVALPLPVMLLLSLEQGHLRRLALCTLPLALLFFALGYYLGGQVLPLAYVNYGNLLPAYSITLCIASFKLLLYLQHFARGGALSYRRLYRLSWRNALTLALSLLFAGAVWVVLLLWAALFKAIGITLFNQLFHEPWFFYPVLALAHGFGIALLRRLDGVIGTLTRIQQVLMQYLLVLLVFVSILFLAALPFTGLQPLWDSGGSRLILWLVALILFFVNAVYRDDPALRPYPLWLHRFIYCGVALLPVYCLISAYGLSLRVEQYGWTLSRCRAALALSLFALLALGYMLSIVRLRDSWLLRLGRVNVAMGLLLLALMLAVNSPLLDFRRLSVASQLARLDRGEVSAEDFDYAYLRYQLARPGYLALKDLRSRFQSSRPLIALRIDSLYTGAPGEPAGDRALILAAIHAGETPLPPGLEDALYAYLRDRRDLTARARGYELLPIDLDRDGRLEYLLLQDLGTVGSATLFYADGGRWLERPLEGPGPGQLPPGDTLDALRQGDYELRAPRWQDIEANGHRLRIR